MKEKIKFYTVIIKKNDDGEIKKEVKIRYKEFIDLLLSFGFRRYDIGKGSIYIRIQNNIVEEYTITRIQDFFLNYVKSLPEELDGIKRDGILEKIYANPSNYFCENKLNLMMCDKNIQFNKDTKNESFIYYQNGFVKISQNGYNLFDYSMLDKCIWQNQILNREFEKKEFFLHQVGIGNIEKKVIGLPENGFIFFENKLCHFRQGMIIKFRVFDIGIKDFIPDKFVYPE